MASRNCRLVAAVVASGLALGTALAAEPPPQAVAVTASEYRFTPNTLAFARGVAYRLHIENRGKELHEFTAPAFFKAIKIKTPGVLNADKTEIVLHPGETKDLDFVPRKAGHYRLICADHDWEGMTGEIQIK